MSCPKGIHSHTRTRCRVGNCDAWAVIDQRHCQRCAEEIPAMIQAYEAKARRAEARAKKKEGRKRKR